MKWENLVIPVTLHPDIGQGEWVAFYRDKTYRGPDAVADLLNMLGKEFEWELIAATPTESQTGSKQFWMFFKRPLYD